MLSQAGSPAAAPAGFARRARDGGTLQATAKKISFAPSTPSHQTSFIGGREQAQCWLFLPSPANLLHLDLISDCASRLHLILPAASPRSRCRYSNTTGAYQHSASSVIAASVFRRNDFAGPPPKGQSGGVAPQHHSSLKPLLSPREAPPSSCPRSIKPGHNPFLYILPSSVFGSVPLVSSPRALHLTPVFSAWRRRRAPARL